jgi:8-oxo-dGTP pyrophosphatase MutT (NUDIX family)
VRSRSNPDLRDPLRRLPDLAAHLATALDRPLPGARIHDRLSPRLLDGSLPPHAGRERPAAVLILLFPRDEVPHVVLTVRSAGLPHHADQISLPGGRPAPGETAEDTALREAVEEVGVDLARVTVAGRLTPVHIAVSGFTVQPVVALADAAPAFVPNPGEVAAVLEVSLPALAEPATLRSGRRIRGSIEIDAPYFAVGDHQVWGATAMLLGELLAVCGWEPA